MCALQQNLVLPSSKDRQTVDTNTNKEYNYLENSLKTA